MCNMLNEGQRELVRESWARVGSFRRLAGEVVCGGKLADAAASLESLACALGQLDIIPYSRIRMGKESQELIVGSSTAAKEKACHFVARQIGFPSELLDLYPKPFLSDRSLRAYDDPTSAEAARASGDHVYPYEPHHSIGASCGSTVMREGNVG